jgi:nucleoid-associated protein YgaU
MSRIVTAFRFVIGLSMVAAGATLAAPLVIDVARAVMGQRPEAVAQGREAAMPPAQWEVAVQQVVAPPANDFVPPPAPQWPPLADSAPGDASATPPPARDYAAPVPPSPLPPVAAELGAVGPEFAGTYRSTLDVPPPPLLDAQRPPPPAVAWSAPDVPRPVAATMPAAVVPQSYVIRDGDDLTGIATRFYGHASAAGAIWGANRDRLPDPNMLPIGAELRLPAPWTVAAGLPGGGGGGAAIEPHVESLAAVRRLGDVPGSVATAAPTDPPVRAGAAWLVASGPQPPLAAALATRPAAIRVAPGDTLASIGHRFYGDPHMAARIWEANRDRLRSPELLVPGMELRLP